ncbi:MAG: hypothetical protein ACJA2P_002283 [Rhodoferax sp.]
MEATVVVAMAAGLAKPGAAIPINWAEAKGDAKLTEEAVGLAQPASKELTDRAPKGSMGAAASIFSAARREGIGVIDMAVLFVGW